MAGQSVRLGGQADVEVPWAQEFVAHGDVGFGRDPGYEAALDEDGERHGDEDDVVYALGLGYAGSDDEGAQKDGYGAFEAGPEDEDAFSVAEFDRDGQEAYQDRAYE